MLPAEVLNPSKKDPHLKSTVIMLRHYIVIFISTIREQCDSLERRYVVCNREKEHCMNANTPHPVWNLKNPVYSFGLWGPSGLSCGHMIHTELLSVHVPQTQEEGEVWLWLIQVRDDKAFPSIKTMAAGQKSLKGKSSTLSKTDLYT